MAPRRSPSARVRALVVLPLLGLLIAGCGTTGSKTSTSAVDATPTGPNNSLTIYLSDPPAVKADPALQDVVYAAQLAYTQHARAVKSVSLKLVPVTRSISDNARKAIEQSSVIAYFGEIPNGQSTQTVGITNAEAVLQLSPTDGVRPAKTDFESFSTYGRTFASLPLMLGTSPAALTKADPAFPTSFKTAFRHAPSPQAILGYDAMWTLLRVIAAAKGSADSRTEISASMIATLKANAGQANPANFTIKLK